MPPSLDWPNDESKGECPPWFMSQSLSVLRLLVGASRLQKKGKMRRQPTTTAERPSSSSGPFCSQQQPATGQMPDGLRAR